MFRARPCLRAAVLATSLLATVAAWAPAAPAGAQEVAPDAYDSVLDITFPVDPSKVTYSDWFDSARSGGRVHKATDIMGTKLLPIYAATAGTVTRMTVSDGLAGYYLNIVDAEGRTYSYVHLNNDNPGTDDGLGTPEQAYAPGIGLGTKVTEGQHIAYMGDSGNAESTSPHLHFSISDPEITDPYGTTYRNPYPSLVVAEDAGRVPTQSAAAVPAAPPPPPPPPLPSPPSFAAVCAGTTAGRFTDVGSTNVHHAAVDCLAHLAIAKGLGDGRYDPSGQVTRLQMASFVARLLEAGGVALPTDPPDAYDDDADTVHELAANQLTALRVIRGDTGEKVRDLEGEIPMKRDRMAAWMARAYALVAGKELPATSTDFFHDDAAYHHADINRLAAAGIVQGTAPGTYSPRLGVRRDQMASYLARTLAAAKG